MKKILLTLPFLFLCSCYEEQIIPVKIDAVVHIKDDNHSSPLYVSIENKTKCANGFQWTFEGGEPESSTQQNPGIVKFTTPGEHKIVLEAWNEGDRRSETYTVRVDSTMTAGFNAVAEVNNHAPATFHITNSSSGGSSYQWTFEGATPSEYTGKQPPAVTYQQSGVYTIRLVVENGSTTATFSQEIEVAEPLDASFTILPSPDDDDMEAPLHATFASRLQGVESLSWECAGAIISDGNTEKASIYFPTEGIYTVYLNVSNGKENKRISQGITVKANTNLLTINDIHLGINTAQGTIGSYYSTRLRRSFLNSELTEQNGALIDITFMGLNAHFSYNRFVSPDKLSTTPLKEIPGAQTTKFLNRQDLFGTLVTPAQFAAMTTDALLKNLSIDEPDAELENFDKASLPRVVLFQTADGRNGAILVKEAIENEKENSYIVVDIKIQKND
ncbi:MAG: hypothetical protein LBN27_10960 [Prevotellaceae bacterium]|jgi:PKD repeat protein|nr:hypothetical protein [Prevotellaceae bacterium]